MKSQLPPFFLFASSTIKMKYKKIGFLIFYLWGVDALKID